MYIKIKQITEASFTLFSSALLAPHPTVTPPSPTSLLPFSANAAQKVICSHCLRFLNFSWLSSPPPLAFGHLPVTKQHGEVAVLIVRGLSAALKPLTPSDHLESMAKHFPASAYTTLTIPCLSSLWIPISSSFSSASYPFSVNVKGIGCDPPLDPLLFFLFTLFQDGLTHCPGFNHSYLLLSPE